MKPSNPKRRLRWAVDVANGEKTVDLELIHNLFSEPWVFYDFTGEGTKRVPGPRDGWPSFFSDMAGHFRDMLECAADHRPLTPPKSGKRPVTVFDDNLGRYVERETMQDLTLPTRIMAKLYSLILEHGHLLGYCKAPARMKRGRRPKGTPRQKPEGECGKLFLGKKKGQIYCDTTCGARAASHRKHPRKQSSHDKARGKL